VPNGTIDLNADVGENPSLGPGVSPLGHEEQLLALVSSANIACGFHAGDPSGMRRAVRTARQNGVSLGAHPAYPDRRGFGRVPMTLPLETVVDDVIYQVGALAAIAQAEGARLRHVKPHGALYESVSLDPVRAVALAQALRKLDPGLRLMLRAGSPSIGALVELGFAPLSEGFADRGYLADGSLAPRRRPGAVLTDPKQVAERALALALGRPLTALDGGSVTLQVDSICLHGDTPGAAQLARAVRERLQQASIRVAAPQRRA
jgi:UPF0271 protein